MKKLSLTRRTVLKGCMGGAVVSVGLPLLDCFLNENGTAFASTGAPLPEQYFRFLRLWVALGVVAFLALVVVFYLMVAKPML